MSMRKFGTGQVTGTDESDLSKTAAREGGDWDQEDRDALARENAKADEGEEQ